MRSINLLATLALLVASPRALQAQALVSCTPEQKSAVVKSEVQDPSTAGDDFTSACQWQGDFLVCKVVRKKTPGCVTQKSVRFAQSAGKCQMVGEVEFSSAAACKSLTKDDCSAGYLVEMNNPIKTASRDEALKTVNEYELRKKKESTSGINFKDCSDNGVNYKCTWYLGPEKSPTCALTRSYRIKKKDDGVCHVSERTLAYATGSSNPECKEYMKRFRDDSVIYSAPECVPVIDGDKSAAVAIDMQASGGEDYCDCPAGYRFSDRGGKPYCVKTEASCGKYRIARPDGSCECPWGFSPKPGAEPPCECKDASGSMGGYLLSETYGCYNEKSCADLDGATYDREKKACVLNGKIVQGDIHLKTVPNGGTSEHNYSVGKKIKAE